MKYVVRCDDENGRTYIPRSPIMRLGATKHAKFARVFDKHDDAAWYARRYSAAHNAKFEVVARVEARTHRVEMPVPNEFTGFPHAP